MKYRYKLSALSIVMAAIMLVGMTGVSAAPVVHSAMTTAPAVTAPITGTPVGVTDIYGWGWFATQEWYIAQGAPTTGGYNIYFQNFANGGVWTPMGTGTNPTGISTPSAFYIMARGTNGMIWAKKSTDGLTWSPVSLPALAAQSGTGPSAAYTFDPNNLQIFYVNSQKNLVDVTLDLNTAESSTVNLGGIVLATPAAATDNSGVAKTVVVKGTGGAIYEQTYLAGAWSGWSRKFHDGLIGNGAWLTADPGSPNNMYLFVAGTDSHVYVLQSTNGGISWRVPNPVLRPGVLGWVSLAGVTTSGVSAHETTSLGFANGAYVDMRGGNGDIWENFVFLNNPTVTLSGGWYDYLAGP